MIQDVDEISSFIKKRRPRHVWSFWSSNAKSIRKFMKDYSSKVKSSNFSKNPFFPIGIERDLKGMKDYSTRNFEDFVKRIQLSDLQFTRGTYGNVRNFLSEHLR